MAARLAHVWDSHQSNGDSESQLNDSELVRRCVQGDPQSYRLLYRRYQSPVRSTLYQLCGSSYLDDGVQEVFLRVWKGLPKFRKTAKFSTWLYRITCNVAFDRRRQLAQQHQLSLRVDLPSVSEDTSDLMQLHYQDLVRRGLEHLSWEHRTVVVLHDLEDMPQKEIAQVLEIPLGTVKSRLFHGRAAMRQFLEEQGVQL
ncbi:sigma-70 family RNA polymerase sigma factor [Roseofilum sp. BLCC_M154]|uniref:Sigma-70 family RNA polymerase sigma factor n=1 Tax=Roseofilum acuticapitatum BLCC-M154 TaxID=3022444 RepID=A0ABT7AYU5_9CYAN|nr:sigma-70 family RNA polymerase sigma factor [Roseofilum acuticapitatum]MDJ1172074.1 sigma-70 family RNA polymerase sigma factor [Roseofilum acuticapitatum BLCC-M154]